MSTPTLQRTLSKIVEPMSKSLVVSSWSFLPPQPNSAGLAFSAIACDNEPVTFTLSGRSHFEVSALAEGAPSLKLQLEAATESELECVFACVLAHVEENAATFGLTPQEARERYKPPLTKNGVFPANLRVKVAQSRYWEDGKLVGAPETHVGCTWQARVHLKSLWFAPNAWGVSCSATDLQEVKTEMICPF